MAPGVAGRPFEKPRRYVSCRWRMSCRWRTVTHETTTQTMTDDERLQKLRDDYRDTPIAQIEYERGRRLRGSDEYEVLHSLLNEAHAAAYAPEQQRHREFKRVHWIGAAIALAGMVALWIQACRPSHPSAAPANPPTAISTVPTPPESPAVTSAAPPPEESVPTPEESAPAPEES